jgi:hypothetical protein
MGKVNALKSARTGLPDISAYLPTVTDEGEAKELEPEIDEVEIEVV